MNEVVLLERPAAHVAVVTLNRPAVCNAVNGELAASLGRIALQVEADGEIRVVVLMGAGERSFCAGADLKAVAEGRVSDLSTGAGGFAGVVGLPRRKLWIAAVQGAVLAGGLELMLSCDFAVAAAGSRFGLPEVQRGLVATEGGLYRLPRAVPRGLALRMIASGETIDCVEALRHGLVTEIVEASMLRSHAVVLATRICANAPLAVQESLAIARDAHAQSDETLDGRCRTLLRRLEATADFLEGSRAFVERRAPVWRGQ